MDPEPLPRKLVAILYADVAEYARLTGEDEDATHRLLADYLDLIAETVDRYGGEVMNYAGDAALAKFEAAVDALACAGRIQNDLRSRNAALPDERKLQFRIGVNLADVIEDRHDIYGEGVNVAARLESLAEPGGICVTESVHTAVGEKLPFEYELLGECQVKHIATPVKTYRVRVKPDAEVPESTGALQKRKQVRRRVAAAAGLALLAVAGAFAWFNLWQPADETGLIERAALPLPDKPSIAVLPFLNMSDDQMQEYFADGVTEDLITDLSKMSGLFVIARNSTFAYKGKFVPARQVAAELGVRYVLEGSVRRADDRIRINTQLVDAATGGHLWAERYDAPMTDIFALQDQVTQKVVNALAVHLTGTEGRNRKETDNPDAYDAFLRGRAFYDLRTPDDYARALPYFEKAIRLDPGYTRAHAWLAAMYWQIWNDDWESALGITASEAMARLERHLGEAMKDSTPMAHYVAAALGGAHGDYNKAIAESERAIALNPNAAIGYKSLARILNKAGRPAAGLDAIQKALRLDPRGDDSGQDSYRIGESLFLLGRYDEAAEMFLRYINRSGDEEWGSLFLAAAYGQLGRASEGKVALDKFNTIRSKRRRRPYTLAHFDDWDFVPAVRREYREGLRKAGMPPGASSSPVLAGVLFAPAKVDGATTIDAAQARMLWERAVPFIDVRGNDREWHSGHISGARHLHLYHDFGETTLAEIVAKGDEVVIYGGGLASRESAAASARAVAWGFEKVYFFREGLPGWQKAGFGLEVSLP